MNKNIYLFFLGILGFAHISLGQGNPGQFIAAQSLIADSKKLIEAYSAPAFKALGTTQNNAWASTAKVHNPFRFDLMLNVVAVAVPKSDQTFDINNLGLSQMRAQDPNKHIAQTVSGDKVETGIAYDDPFSPGSTKTLKSPKGTGVAYIPGPSLQLSLGLPLHTEVMVRFIPTSHITYDNYDYGTTGLLGGGLKIGISPYIWKDTIPVDIAVMGSMYKLNYNYDLPKNYSSPGVKDVNPYDDQKLAESTTGYSLDLLVSKKIGALTIMGDVGYQSTTSQINLLGTFRTATNSNVVSYVDINNPISVSYAAYNTIKAGLSFRLKAGPVLFQLGGTLSKYSSVNFGLGIDIDKK